MLARKDDWVIIHNVVLNPEERSPQIPEDTKKVPLEMWVKGYLKQDAKIGDQVEVKTMTGRDVKGTLIEVNPHYEHDYGKCIPELLKIGSQLRDILAEEGK